MYCELVEYKGVYRVTLQHVPSHTGNVGNETVDAMAKTGATMTTTTDVTQQATRVFHGRKDGNDCIRVAAPTWQPEVHKAAFRSEATANNQQPTACFLFFVRHLL